MEEEKHLVEEKVERDKSDYKTFKGKKSTAFDKFSDINGGR